MKSNGPRNDDLINESRRIWNTNAEWWDDTIGDGNEFQIELIEPTTEELLSVRQGETVVDVACGAGRLGRRLASLGAHVIACDFSAKFVERARKRTPADLSNIEYHVADATDEQQLLSLGTNRFDAAVCTMALMDMAEIEPLFSALSRMLKPAGRFVFSVMHPCFNSMGTRKFCEDEEVDGQYAPRSGVKVFRYRTPTTAKGVGIVGQPDPHFYFDRPLEALFAPAFRAGFVIDGFREAGFQARPGQRPSLSWRDVPEIPPVLVVRMRLCR